MYPVKRLLERADGGIRLQITGMRSRDGDVGDIVHVALIGGVIGRFRAVEDHPVLVDVVGVGDGADRAGRIRRVRCLADHRGPPPAPV